MMLLEVARLMDCHQHFFASDPELRSWLQYSPVQSSLAARLPAPAGHVDADRFADQRGFDSRQGDSISNSDSNSNLAARSVCRGSAGRGQPDVQKATYTDLHILQSYTRRRQLSRGTSSSCSPPDSADLVGPETKTPDQHPRSIFRHHGYLSSGCEESVPSHQVPRRTCDGPT